MDKDCECGHALASHEYVLTIRMGEQYIDCRAWECPCMLYRPKWYRWEDCNV